jgi:hypothetical protein
MGQLIKLQDYISRYETDIYSYPSRFTRLKRQQWEKTRENWETDGMDAANLSFSSLLPDDEEEKEKRPFFAKMKNLLRKNKKDEEVWMEESEDIKNEEEENPLEFTVDFHVKPKTIEDLKKQYLDQLFRFQLKWASTTLFERSNLHPKFFFDERLKFFLQRFPDTYLCMYKPIFLLKKAPVETEAILLTPSEAWCITFLEEEDLSVYIGSPDRFWEKKRNTKESKILNPLLALNRTEKIIRKIFHMNEIELPIHKLLLSRNGYIDYPSSPFDVKLVDSRNFEEWFQSMRSNKSPLKHMQLKGAQALLQYCQTSSLRRMEWEETE